MELRHGLLVLRHLDKEASLLRAGLLIARVYGGLARFPRLQSRSSLSLAENPLGTPSFHMSRSRRLSLPAGVLRDRRLFALSR
jgi:hypothetical protein